MSIFLEYYLDYVIFVLGSLLVENLNFGQHLIQLGQFVSLVGDGHDVVRKVFEMSILQNKLSCLD